MDGAHSDAIPLFMTFVNFKKAFDSIDRDMMFAVLLHYGIPEKTVNAIRVLHDASATNATTIEKHFNHSMRHTIVLDLEFIS
jgi:hypothetical protein